MLNSYDIYGIYGITLRLSCVWSKGNTSFYIEALLESAIPVAIEIGKHTVG